MNILEKIVLEKRKEVARRKKQVPLDKLLAKPDPILSCDSFFHSLKQNRPSVIAEFKRKSPSKGIINPKAKVKETVHQYAAAGAAAVSVLTDVHFQGEDIDLERAVGISAVPVLRKDFMVDEYQLAEAKKLGASAVLLIAAVLSKEELQSMFSVANDLTLDVLFEVHNEAEIEKLPGGAKIIGVNNRNLESFEVSIDTSLRLLPLMPSSCIKVSESGISDIKVVQKLYEHGFDAFLIGENFMKTENPGASAREFISAVKELKNQAKS